eukprot:gene361-6775_t
MQKKSSYTFKLSKGEMNLPKSVQQQHIQKTYSILEITLKSAKNLEPKNSNRTSDPFVKFYCNDRELKSSVQKKTCDPTWNEIFEFSISCDKNNMPLDKFRFDIWHSHGFNIFKKDEYLGGSAINLTKVPKDKKTEMTIKLEGVTQGEITMDILGLNFGEEKKEVSSESKSTSSKRIGPQRYIKGKKLAQGGFGGVYIAKDTKNDKEVILKQIECTDFDDANIKLQEFLPIRKLDHPYLIKYHDLYLFEEKEDDENLFGLCYIMDHYPKGDLQRYLNKYKNQGKFLSMSKVITYFKQLIEGLLYLHEKKLMHRDLKPANVLISDDFQKIVICDFGMVREVDGTMAHTVLGTPQYMAPEVSQSLPYDFSADIWSLGVIFYEMITLKFKTMHYVRAMEEKEEYYDRIKEEILDIDENYKQILEIVLGMLSLDPKKRISLSDSLKILDSVEILEE